MHKHAESFREFASKIEKNDEGDFAGAFLIVAPGGEQVSGIMVGDPDVASFFGVVKTKFDAVVTKIDEEAKRNQAFGRR